MAVCSSLWKEKTQTKMRMPLLLLPLLLLLARRAAAFFPDGRLPDQALVNEYVEGSGIAAHADGPLYEPCAVIVSLESSARLDFFTDGDERVASVLLRPRSVVAFADAAYLSLKHGIAAARADTVDGPTPARSLRAYYTILEPLYRESLVHGDMDR